MIRLAIRDALRVGELELELIQSHVAQKQVLRGEVGDEWTGLDKQ